MKMETGNPAPDATPPEEPKTNKPKLYDYAQAEASKQKAEQAERERIKGGQEAMNEALEAQHRAVVDSTMSYDKWQYNIREVDTLRAEAGNELDDLLANRRFYREVVLTCFEDKCCNCGSTESLQLDHWGISNMQGGNFILQTTDGLPKMNVTVLCASCNASKGISPCYIFVRDEEKRKATRLMQDQLYHALWRKPSVKNVFEEWYSPDNTMQVVEEKQKDKEEQREKHRQYEFYSYLYGTR